MTTYIYPYKAGSVSAKELANALELKRVKRVGSTIRGGYSTRIINWGSSTMPDYRNGTTIINTAPTVALATDKVRSLAHLSVFGLNVLESTTDKAVAATWDTIYCRTLSRANSGRGIVVCRPGDLIVDAPLYTKGILTFRKEFRIHVVNGVVIDWQAKRRRDGWVDEGAVNTSIRNYAAGWVFCREDRWAPTEETKQLALDAVLALGLDFGAVDMFEIGYNTKRPMIIEVNTACGLTGTTLERYTEAFKEHYCG
jgi:hypothetical protein